MKSILLTTLLGLTLTACGEDAKAKPYPLTTCVVSDEKLGGMGKPVVFTHDGKEVQLCCKACRKDFDADPAKYMAKISEAAAKK